MEPSDGGKAFLEATLPHLDAVYRVARHAGFDRWQAEDLVQETYLRAFAAFGSHTGPSTRAWLVAICLNVARSEGRKRARRPREQPAAQIGEPADTGPDVFSEVNARLDRAAVSAALAELPPEQRLAIVLMDLAGHTASEVAALLGCPRGTVLARVHRGRRAMAALLPERGIGHDLS